MDHSFTKICYVIGKGPSLDRLSNQDFEPGYSILCINDSIHKVYGLGLTNPIFCFTQDISLESKCKVIGPTFIIGSELVEVYKDHPNTYVTTMIAPKITTNMAIWFAKKRGCNHFKMVCFDACVTGETGYAGVIGRKPIGDPIRFLQHRKWIEDYNKRVKIEWLTPVTQASEVSDTLQP